MYVNQRFKKMLPQVAYVLIINLVQRNKMLEDSRTEMMTAHMYKVFSVISLGHHLMPSMWAMSPYFASQGN